MSQCNVCVKGKFIMMWGKGSLYRMCTDCFFVVENMVHNYG